MPYPYKRNSYNSNGEVLQYERTFAMTAVEANSVQIFNIPYGERVTDIAFHGVASVSALSIRAYGFTEPQQDLSKAVRMELIETGASTSATVITQATSSVTPVSMVRVLPFAAVFGGGYGGPTWPFGMGVTITVASVTATTGSPLTYVIASPRS